MSKDYKNADRKGGGRRSGSSLLIGILIGLVLGLGIALAVAWYINKMPSPFLVRSKPPAKSEAPGTAGPAAPKSEGEAVAVPESKPRFDFYKILPGNEEPTVQRPNDEQKKPEDAAKEVFFLQAGAFQNAAEADNLKARLALMGIEASIQAATSADKGAWFRVRTGPYTTVAELNRARDTLKQNGVNTSLIRARE